MPPTGAWPTTQACALTGNRTDNALVRRPALNPLSYSSQGNTLYFSNIIYISEFALETVLNDL